MSFITKYKFTLLLTFTLVVIMPQHLQSQYYESRITQIMDEQGNTPSATFAIVEDAKGFIWFGTVDGLYRFDGYNYKSFQHHEDDSNSLSNNTIRDLAISSDQKIWIATSGGGLNCLDLETEQITRYVHTGTKENEISGNDIWSLTIDRKGFIWMGVSDKGLDCLNPAANIFTHYKLFPKESKSTYSGRSIRSLYEDSHGLIWAGVGNLNLCILNPETKAIKTYTYPTSNPEGPSNCTIFGIYEDQDQNVWLSTYGGGINIYNRKQKTFRSIQSKSDDEISLLSDHTYAITEKENGEFWMATESGLSIFDSTTQRFTNYTKNNLNPNSLSENRLRCIFKDSRGIVWIGNESGVDKFVEQSRFKIYKHIPGEKNNLIEGIVRAICEDRYDNVWISLLDNGLVRYHKPSQKYHYYFEQPIVQTGILGNLVGAIFEDSELNLWIGEWDTGLYKYNRNNNSFELVVSTKSEKSPLSSDQIQVIREAKPGYLWVGTEYGLNLFNTRTKEVIQYWHDPEDPNSLSGNSIQSNAFVTDPYGNVWAGTWSYGLNKIEFRDKDLEKPVFTHWLANSEDSNSLNNNNIISLCYGYDDLLWIGTFGGGLNRYDVNRGTFKHYTTKEGLPNNIIFAIIEDDEHNLWLSTDRGISKFNPGDESFINFDKSDGLQDNHFFWGASFQSDSGEIYFGGTNGLNSFLPENVTIDSYNPKPQLINISTYGDQEIKSKTISPDNRIELLHFENYLSFEFSAMDFKDPYKNQYQYKLEGFDKEWQYNGNRRFANYTNLPPDSYTFRVKVTNNAGVWSKNELEYDVIILPPWWRTWWAITIFSVLFVGSILGFYFIRIGILQAQKKRLTEQVTIRTAEIAEKNEELKHTLDQLEQTQNALIESEKMASLGILSAGVAHEINNPLNFIAGSISTIKDEIQNLEDCKELSEDKKKNLDSFISYAEVGIDRITNIIKSLRTYASKGDGTLQLTNIENLIHSAITIIHSKIPHFVDIEYKLKKIPDVPCRQDQLSQVFINIVDNALQAILEKGEKEKQTISIETNTDKIQGKEHAVISIINTGTTIAEKDLKHVFDPFFTTKSPDKGSGLGLYISYNIVKEHNGILKVESENNSVRFTVNLPYSE